MPSLEIKLQVNMSINQTLAAGICVGNSIMGIPEIASKSPGAR